MINKDGTKINMIGKIIEFECFWNNTDNTGNGEIEFDG